MKTIFEQIIAGDIPGKFVWADDLCVAIATIEPVQKGHVLVIPRTPVDKWTQLPPQHLAHLARISQIIGTAQETAFEAPRSSVVIAGFEVPHTHIHVIPAYKESDCLLSNAEKAENSEITDAMNALRDALRTQGYSNHVPMEIDAPDLP